MNDDERDCFRPMLNGIVTDDKIDRNYIKAVSVAVVTPSSSLQFKDDGRWMIAAERGVVMLALGLTVSSLRRC